MELTDKFKDLIGERPYDVWDFGSDKVFSERLIDLVLTGEKTATIGLLDSHKKIPKIGDLGVITDSTGEPRCLIEYTDVQIKPFLEVDLEFAKAEGEGVENLEEWRAEHREVFKEWYGKSFSDQSLVVCEQFKLLFPNGE